MNLALVEELRAKLESLRVETAQQYELLVPLVITGSGPALWRDADIAVWLGASVEAVRKNIVANLHGFLVDETCAAALLGIREVLLVMEGKWPRVSALNFIANETSAIVAYLRATYELWRQMLVKIDFKKE